MLADQPLGAPLDREAELVLEAHGAQQPQRVVLEHAGVDGTHELRLQVAAPVERIDVARRPGAAGRSR